MVLDRALRVIQQQPPAATGPVQPNGPFSFSYAWKYQPVKERNELSVKLAYVIGEIAAALDHPYIPAVVALLFTRISAGNVVVMLEFVEMQG